MEEPEPNFYAKGRFLPRATLPPHLSDGWDDATGAHTYLQATWFFITPTEPPVTQEIELDCEEL